MVKVMVIYMITSITQIGNIAQMGNVMHNKATWILKTLPNSATSTVFFFSANFYLIVGECFLHTIYYSYHFKSFDRVQKKKKKKKKMAVWLL